MKKSVINLTQSRKRKRWKSDNTEREEKGKFDRNLTALAE